MRKAASGAKLSGACARELAACDDLEALAAAASARRQERRPNTISYSRKVFIPLTELCRNVCHYCTFAKAPSRLAQPYLRPDDVLNIARQGAAAGCKEALFTLGDKPEQRYRAAEEQLAELGYASTIDYVAAMAELVFDETGLFPHVNAGIMTPEEMQGLRAVSISQGIMLESVSERLCEKGGPHYGSPDKRPAVRLANIAAAGALSIPFTTGLLIGIGETREERIDSLLAIRELHARYGHIQELIIQPFRAKPDTKMRAYPNASLDELLWSIAVARILFGKEVAIQTPPNLSAGGLKRLIDAGIDDWGGVSPVTPDHVNPELPWPHLERLREETAQAGKVLVERLAVYPDFAARADRWVDPRFKRSILAQVDAEGFLRDSLWHAGAAMPPPAMPVCHLGGSDDIARILDRARGGEELAEREIVRLFAARDGELAQVSKAADLLRQEVSGETVSYVVNRNINYTNICYFKCAFCAFSKGKKQEELRGAPYDLGDDEIARRVAEAWERGATEVCLQGGIHPKYTGETYLRILETVKRAAPEMHIHAFSPLEISQGAKTLDLSVDVFLAQLQKAGLDTLPGTAAEILDDEIRAVICPDKVNTVEWLEVMEAAHSLGLNTTATIMYGHVERPEHWARHLLRVRRLQQRTGGFTEFVPLPFVHMEAPIALKGHSRHGPTFREAILMHAVARLALHSAIPNIQASWVKLGREGALLALRAGANDLGGTLMNESITRAAGAAHGQELGPLEMDQLISSIGRRPRQRTTLYSAPAQGQVEKGRTAAPIAPIKLELTARPRLQG
ncbi:MAG: 5-amino-6-(D-ribitylamino)uracil--L-tyrosine 4-hydroxyphenyl transferase CofH [Rhodovibrionaceae bacterium]